MGFIFDSILLELVFGALLLFWLFYKYMTSKYSYWKDRSIAYEEPIFPYGTDKDIIFFRKHLGQHFQSLYMKYKNEKVVGLFSFHRPYLLVRDPELLKHIMTKDFNNFIDRGLIDPEVLTPAGRHLFNMTGEPWKIMRHKLTPAFTSGKMKMMFFLMEACSNEFVKALEPLAEKNEKIPIKDFIACFTTDVISSCAFGLQTNSIQNPDNEVRLHGSKLFEVPSFFEIIRQTVASVFPWTITKLHIFKPLTNDAIEFFMKMVDDTVTYREKIGVIRNDFIDILISIKNNKSLLEDETNDNKMNDQTKDVANGDTGMTLEEMAAQAVLFFAAGFETSASAMSFCLYEISLNPEIQKKMRKEIDEVMTKHNGKLNYQALQEMNYMEAVINETLRRYASLSILNRECTETYKLPGTDLVLTKGMKVFIPTYAIHHDPAYYPDPYKFDPERFTDDKIKTKNNYTFLPFGEGPRMCIGNRFAMMQMKTCLSMVLHKFELTMTEDTPPTLDLSTKTFFTTSILPIILKISKHND